MNLTQTLLGYLNRVFNKDPQSFVALSFSYAGSDMSWSIADDTLTVIVTGGSGAGFTLALDGYTLLSLASHIAGLTGFTVNSIAAWPLSGMSGAVLLDGSGKQSAGQTKVLGYTSILYAWMGAVSTVLAQAQIDVVSAIQQISINDAAGNPSASGVWIDEIGGYFGVPRLPSEPDDVYGARIIAEVLRAKGNNVAIESAIKYYTGQQTMVVDVSVPAFSIPLYNGVYSYNGVREHNSTGTVQYNLFDVSVGYDLLNGGDISTFLATVTSVLGRLRDAGMHLRALALTGSAVGDDLTPPGDAFGTITVTPALADTLTAPTGSLATVAVGMRGFADTLTAPGDGTDTATVAYATKYNGIRSYNAAVEHLGGHTTHGTLEGAVTSIT